MQRTLQGLDRDVYQILKKLEVSVNDNKPFSQVTVVYDAIKRSNSSLARFKKRPLEDSIERVLQFRKEELGDSDDSEAEIERLESKSIPEDDRFLLNRQMTKHWHQDTQKSKKRRLHDEAAEDHSSSDSRTIAPATPQTPAAPAVQMQPVSDKTEKDDKTTQKKTLKLSRFHVEQPTERLTLGGMDENYREVLKSTKYCLKYPGIYAKTNWHRLTGIVLSGPAGMGQAELIRSLAAELEVPLVSITGCFDDPERMEKNLMEAFDEAMRLAPSIVLIEELDWYMSRPGSQAYTEHHRRAVVQLRRQMQRIRQELPKDLHVIAMATTSNIADVEPAALREGVFEQTLQMRLPGVKERQRTLELLMQDRSVAKDVDFAKLAKAMHGYVHTDMVQAMHLGEELALERIMQKMTDADIPMADEDAAEGDAQSSALATWYQDATITAEDFEVAIKRFTPSLRQEGFTELPNVTWDQVGAMAKVRKELQLSITLPIRDPDLYRRAGLRASAGVLLWGPPGCGKTLVAQAVANEAQASFILINGPELLNKYVGESERAVRSVFQRARASAPTILFFDEMDSLVPRRDNTSTEAGARVVNSLLAELDGAHDRTGVYVIGTTNRPDMIDAAMLRPGRLSTRLFVDLPTPDERVDILKAIYRTSMSAAANSPYTLPEEDVARLDRVGRDVRCNDFSGADLKGLHDNAAKISLNKWLSGEKTALEVIDDDDWDRALATTRRSVSNPETYRKLADKLGRE
ncbi:P-loop containing nucleoside triphosphate hydrolase protein [Stachybotrys elegans]|uniref:Peroxisomal ATPase PEX1 n=1 Tax=Stachybotrys elegans TaxID=80388 RepID=A0A8K0WS65_9HYPO|nr:P-loop containing nucleoside triphosphate hydrolase protein [Stachybotrys elegans]